MALRTRISSEGNTREQILAAALELFSERGFANVSTRDLAEKAGIARSHVYHYFKNWQTLRHEVFDRFAQEQYDDLLSGMANLNPDQKLAVFFREFMADGSKTGIAMWLDAWDEALHDPVLAEAYIAVNKRWQALLASIIAEGNRTGQFSCGSPERAARQLYALAMGYSDTLILAPSEALVREILSEVAEATRMLVGSRQ
ncbi:TetR/AcrR family transcriptional regulator (plasmid) [Bosea sp. F3-2]|uniref:TetR/AcrR family transcriptional regulator n=1 Tax=Bosea sp. F3-2 TaxID=2599640 RepID=UPI0011EF7B97|nr:TetR/AcrR family transcriptional regulator [Bosea sp. F3-2]QEL26897.1 TetR/AcrR family transcriptional regulator [Bosea sp. F3-2]